MVTFNEVSRALLNASALGVFGTTAASEARQLAWLIRSLEADGCERWLIDMVWANWTFVPVPKGYQYPDER
jgi:hypothetical protein